MRAYLADRVRGRSTLTSGSPWPSRRGPRSPPPLDRFWITTDWYIFFSSSSNLPDWPVSRISWLESWA
ncbi:hypothetical protein ACFSTC_61930 [Nonomuraea ferruginea]